MYSESLLLGRRRSGFSPGFIQIHQVAQNLRIVGAKPSYNPHDGSQALDELLRRKAGSHAAACSCASRCRISAPCTRNTRKCALYIINATRLRQDHIPQFGRGVCRRHLRATHANECISLEVRHLGERCASCRKTGNGSRKGAASCSTRQPRCRSALSHASWPRRTKRTRCCSKHEPCFVRQHFDGDPLSFERGVASVMAADPPLHREALAFPTPCCSFSHGAGSRRAVIPAKTLLDLESPPGVTSSICTRPTDREHIIASYEMKERSPYRSCGNTTSRNVA